MGYNDENTREIRFQPGSEYDLSAFPRLVGDAIHSWPVSNLAISRMTEGGGLPVVGISLTFQDEEAGPLVVALPLSLARALQQSLADMLDEP